MPETKNVALRKRQQIEKAGRNMFLWVALAAAVLGVAGVAGVALYERIAFNQKVIGAKNETLGTLRHNNATIGELESNIRLLNTDQALVDTPRLDDSEPVSVILDALPATANSSALGASMQQHLLKGSGVTIDNLTMNNAAGESNSSTGSSTSSSSEASDKASEISFEFTISASSANRLKAQLNNLERSIRTINLTSVEIDQLENKMSLTAKGVAYFLPQVNTELTEKVEKP